MHKRRTIKKIFRLFYISLILARYGLDEIILSIHLFSPIRFLAWLNPWNWRRNKNFSRAERLRFALIALGPIFVKFGQALSTRSDLLPHDILVSLAMLQDKVPPFPGTVAMDIITEEYGGKKIAEIFKEFCEVPLASASIAQVHTAKLFNDKEVVVKIVRPNIEKIIRNDLDLLHTLADLTEKYWTEGKRLRVKDIINEFENTLMAELNLQNEAANAALLRRNFLHSEALYVPEVYWPYVKEKVLVMERIYGVPISDMDSLLAFGVDFKLLAERGVELFFTQVFRDCFFHADMHPGNIFVSIKNPKNPQYIAVDFGIMGTLDEKDQRYLAENFVAFFQRDYHQVAKLHLQSGWVPPYTRVAEFESAIRVVCEPIFEKPLKDISCGQLLLNLFQTGRRFDMKIQPQLVLLQKTLLAIEGLGRQLYPDLDLWHTAKPFLENWVKQRLSFKNTYQDISKQVPFWLEKLPELPDLLYETICLARQKLAEPTSSMYNALNKKNVSTKKTSRFGFGLGLLASGILLWFGFTMGRLNQSEMIHALVVAGLVVMLFGRYS